jgi:hypothetical protein
MRAPAVLFEHLFGCEEASLTFFREAQDQIMSSSLLKNPLAMAAAW